MDNMDMFEGLYPDDPACEGGCFSKGDRVRLDGAEGVVRWVGYNKRIVCCRLGVSTGPGPLKFADCLDLRKIL